jgi:class 3 adenylate cyclase
VRPAAAHTLAQVGIEVRVGLHTGEIELRGDDVGGIGVHIAARVSGLADAGEVLVSRTVTDLVAGSGLAFTDRGEHDLKGVPGTWQLFAVERLTPTSGRSSCAEVSTLLRCGRRCHPGW